MKFSSRWALFLGALLLGLSVVSGFAQGGDDQPESKRKVVNRVIPAYPALARSMNLSGSVKLEALITPNGTVKSLRVLGGNPLLADSAQTAVHEWKWEKTDHDTTEILEFKFRP